MVDEQRFAFERLGWSVASLGVLVAARKLRHHYGVQATGRVPLPVALGVIGASIAVRHKQEATDRAYWYEKGRQGEAADFEAESDALREVVGQDQSSTRIIDAAGKTQEQVIAEAKEAMKDGDWRIVSVTPSRAQHPSNGLSDA